MIRRILATLAVSTGLLSAAPAQAATPAVQFTGVLVNPSGPDTRTNAHINLEWFRLANTTRATINLNGWTVRDSAGATYRFGVYNLAAGKYVYVHTGRGTNTATDRYWGSANYIWNNTGDTATLRNPSNRIIDSCTWKASTASTRC